MQIEFDFWVLRRTRWYEYALRFLFGGGVTVAAGLIAKQYGPVFGGLFLAFPAVFPASLYSNLRRKSWLRCTSVWAAR